MVALHLSLQVRLEAQFFCSLLSQAFAKRQGFGTSIVSAWIVLMMRNFKLVLVEVSILGREEGMQAGRLALPLCRIILQVPYKSPSFARSSSLRVLWQIFPLPSTSRTSGILPRWRVRIQLLFLCKCFHLVPIYVKSENFGPAIHSLFSVSLLSCMIH